MLQKILSNFSEDELLAFLPNQAIDFAVNTTSDNVEVNKTKLAGIVAHTKQVEFIFSEKLRYRLIERLKPELLIELFPEFGITQDQVRTKHYDAAVSWATENLAAFSERIGLEEIYGS